MDRRWIAAGTGVTVLVAGGVAGYAHWVGDDHHCIDAVPEVDRDEVAEALPDPVAPDGLLDAVAEAHADLEWMDDPHDRYAVDVELLLDVGDPLGEPSTVVVDRAQPDLTSEGDILLAHGGLVGASFTVSVHDGRDGNLLWARSQEGTSAGGGSVGDSFVLLQTDHDRPLSVAVLDPATGEPAACIPVGTADAGEASHDVTGRRLQRSLGLADAVVVSQPGDRDRPAHLYRVDIASGTADEDRVVWDRPVDEARQVGALHGSDDVVVFAHVDHDTTDRYAVMMELRTDLDWHLDAGNLAVHALDPDTGEGLWSHPAEPATDVEADDVALHTVVGVHTDVVVVAADRLRRDGDGEIDAMETTLLGLDVRTGEPQWSAELSLPGERTFPDAHLYGDVVVAIDDLAADSDHERWYDLVAIEAAGGDERWRIPGRVPRPDRGAMVGDRLLLPGLDLQGLEVIEADTGDSRTLLDGTTVHDLVAEAGLLGVTTGIGDADLFVVYETG